MLFLYGYYATQCRGILGPWDSVNKLWYVAHVGNECGHFNAISTFQCTYVDRFLIDFHIAIICTVWTHVLLSSSPWSFIAGPKLTGAAKTCQNNSDSVLQGRGIGWETCLFHVEKPAIWQFEGLEVKDWSHSWCPVLLTKSPYKS